MKKGDLFKADNRYFIFESKVPKCIIGRLITNGIAGNIFWYIREEYTQISCRSLLVPMSTIRRMKTPYTNVFKKVEINVNKTSLRIIGNNINVIRLFFKRESVYVTYEKVTFNATKRVFVLYNVTKC